MPEDQQSDEELFQKIVASDEDTTLLTGNQLLVDVLEKSADLERNGEESLLTVKERRDIEDHLGDIP